MAIGLAPACFLACILESLGFGLFNMMAGFTVKLVLAGDQPSRRRVVLVVLALIWILTTMHWIVNVYRAYVAFLVFPEGPAAFFATFGHPSYTAKDVAYGTLSLVADTFATYRCYIVWNRSWRVACIPGLLLLGTTAVGYGSIYIVSRVQPGKPIFLSNVAPWITSWFSMALVTNVACTGLIAYKIINTRQCVRGLGISIGVGRKDPLAESLIVVVESAAIYSATLIVLLVSYVCGSNVQYVIIDLIIPVIAIAFTMILMRITLNITSDLREHSRSGSQGTTLETLRFPVAHGPLAVNVTRLVHVNRETYSQFGAKDAENNGDVNENGDTGDDVPRE
ncbi:hypothetical protein DFH06DRAFT_1476323 [Mycena polygramma]|nr:hypothetical protein DFH06DRAFT_1476323 [Mycena polygramma]